MMKFEALRPIAMLTVRANKPVGMYDTLETMRSNLNATPFQGFPCMQQVAFIPEGKNGLRISALYPMHYLWARAYGNYLGLIHLGQFMAMEMGLELKAMTCIALVAKLDEPNLAAPFLEAADAI